MMKSERLLEAIGEIRDDIIRDADVPAMRYKFPLKRAVALVAALALCFCTTVTVLAAEGSDAAYRLLYAVSPALAGRLKPVQLSCEDEGIRLEVISADIDGNQADIYLSLQDTTGQNRIDADTDLFDGFGVMNAGENSGYTHSCTIAGFDEETNTLYAVVQIVRSDLRSIAEDKVTFMLGNLLIGKETVQMELTELIDAEKLSAEARTVHARELAMRGGGSAEDNEWMNREYILPQYDIQLIPGVRLTGAAFAADGLHIQMLYEDVKATDNHGYLEAFSGQQRAEEIYSGSFWHENGEDSYEEYVFDLAPDQAGELAITGEFITSDALIIGDWEVTFELEEIG